MSEAAAQLEHERNRLLTRIQHSLEVPMLVLSLAWLILLVVELTRGLGPVLQATGDFIWILFILHFALEFTLAPKKRRYLRNNWITLLALALPALRVFRIARAFRLLRLTRTIRGLRLVRLLTSLNRGMRALGLALGRRGFTYVAALTIAVTFAGAAGMYAFERDDFPSYGAALWWTAMLVTTIGSDYWPQTPEGRLLCFVLSAYALGVLGYLTATLASFFVDRDAANSDSDVASAADIDNLRKEVEALRAEVGALTTALSNNTRRKGDGGSQR